VAVSRRTDEFATRSGPGWQESVWAGKDVFGTSVPMRGRRYLIEAGAIGPNVTLEAEEAMVYVAAGRGVARVGAESFPLEPESVVWISPGAELVLCAGGEALDALVAEAPFA
jgi:quercetin dioxygenase-like cupin family protein